MYCRMLLLALFPLTKNAYEREAARAVRRYLLRLCMPAAVLCGVLWGAGILLTYGFGFSALHNFYVFLVLFWTLTFAHLIRTAHPSAGAQKEAYNGRLTGYAEKLIGQNKLGPIKVYEYSDTRAQAWMTHDDDPRILVSDTLNAQSDSLGMIGILAHELAHRELPLGTSFPLLLQTFVHYLPDRALRALNKKAGLASQEFVIYQKVMDPREATRRLVNLGVIHAANKWCWHMSSSPALRLREYACDAIAVCIVRNAFPLIHGLSVLRNPQIVQYLYTLDAHPETKQRIAALLAMEERLMQTP